MKYIATFLVIVIGLIYWPINIFYLWVQKWYFKEKERDLVIKWAFAPFYWVLVAIVSAISYPYEKIANLAGH